MLRDLKDVLHRTQPNLLQDLAGAAALGVILVGGLFLPGIV
jgi:hypothetical protein